jgi:hypothetical protein
MERNFVKVEHVAELLQNGPISASQLAYKLGVSEAKAADLLNRAILLRSSRVVTKKEEKK